MLLALVAAIVIGLSLGLLGAGGSVVTVPVLVFILQRPEKIAIAESLSVVSIVALAGAVPYIYRKQVHWKVVLYFGVPGMIGACLGGCGSYFITGNVQLILFAAVMLVIAGFMFLDPLMFEKISIPQQTLSVMVVEGFLLGCLTGFLGIGGGFLIVPSLMILASLPMSIAVGTSLIIISINAFIGFIDQIYILKDLNLSLDWHVITFVATVGIFGSLIGGVINKKISSLYLRRAFGIMILVMGAYILFYAVSS